MTQRGELSLRTVGTSKRRALGRSSEDDELEEETVELRFPKHMIAIDEKFVVDVRMRSRCEEMWLEGESRECLSCA